MNCNIFLSLVNLSICCQIKEITIQCNMIVLRFYFDTRVLRVVCSVSANYDVICDKI